MNGTTARAPSSMSEGARLSRLVRWTSVAVIGFASAVAFFCIADALREALWMPWNAARLAPIVALHYGYQLYYPADHGPVMDMIYGPGMAVAYWPATFARTPTGVVLLGLALDHLFLAAPILAILWYAADPARDRVLPVAAAWLAIVLSFRLTQGTASWLTMISADAPALGLGLLACVFALPRPRGEPRSARALVVAALLTALACFTKQVAVPVAVAITVYLWAVRGTRDAMLYLLWVIAFGVLLAAFAFHLRGWPIVLNAILVPARHPWIATPIAALAGAFAELLRHALLWLAPLAVGLMVVPRAQHCRWRRDELLSEPWVLPLLAAVAMVSTSLLGRVKVGGASGSFHALYYLAAAVGVLCVRLVTRAESGPLIRHAAMIVLIAWLAADSAAGARGAKTGSFRDPLAENPLELAYRFARAHPEEIYFPNDPLLADRFPTFSAAVSFSELPWWQLRADAGADGQ